VPAGSADLPGLASGGYTSGVALPPQKNGVRNGNGPRGLQSPTPEEESLPARHATEKLTEDCEALEQELEELKVKYEMYFLGTERIEPARRRDDLKRSIARLKSAFTRNTGLRFRIQALHARYLSYERLWLRAGREKEEGTYRRDLFKARLRSRREPEAAGAGAPAGKRPRSAGGPEDVDLSGLDGEAAAPPAGENPPPAATAPASVPVEPPRRAAPAAPPARPAPPAGAMTEDRMRALYDAYLSAKKSCNEDTSKISYEAVARSVAKQIPELMTRYGAKSVDFKVVVKDGKAVLKAVPKT